MSLAVPFPEYIAPFEAVQVKFLASSTCSGSTPPFTERIWFLLKAKSPKLIKEFFMIFTWLNCETLIYTDSIESLSN